jgi:hypothetical protein
LRKRVYQLSAIDVSRVVSVKSPETLGPLQFFSIFH